MEINTNFEKHFGKPPYITAIAPGRVNLIGEHVDYNDGCVLPIAINRAVFIAADTHNGSGIHLHAADLEASVTFDLDTIERRQNSEGAPLPDWAYYPAGVAWALNRAGHPVPAIRAVYNSNVPIGAGLSSSAAVEVGFAVLWMAISEWKLDCIELARICQEAEVEYVGLPCGLMDQFASACGKKGHALLLDTRSLEWRTVSLPEDTSVVVADSGVRRSLTTSAYAKRRESCETAVRLLQEYMPGIKSLRDVSSVEFAAYSEFLPETERKRAEHVVKEIARVDSAVAALERNDERAFGALMYASHASLRDLYEVSVPELDILVELTREIPGCMGARLTGGGFGGCTVNLVQKAYENLFLEKLVQDYFDQTGLEARVYPCIASSGANVRYL